MRRTRLIPPRDPGLAVPASFERERIWYLDRFDPGNIARTLRLAGPVRIDALQAALDAIVRRHESLEAMTSLAADRIRVSCLPEADHLFTPIESREGRMNAVCDWMPASFGAPAEPAR